MAPKRRRVELVLTNERARQALEVIAETLVDLKTDLPWREDVRRAARACRYALRHLAVIEVE